MNVPDQFPCRDGHAGRASLGIRARRCVLGKLAPGPRFAGESTLDVGVPLPPAPPPNSKKHAQLDATG